MPGIYHWHARMLIDVQVSVNKEASGRSFPLRTKSRGSRVRTRFVMFHLPIVKL